MSILIYISILLIYILFTETIGLWFIHNKLIIPANRVDTAKFVYQFSIISSLFTILATPYIAVVIAREDMNIYAYISIIEAILKLIMVFFLRSISLDKLQLYGILMCLVTFISTTLYILVCKKKYTECKLKFFFLTHVY